MRVLRDADITRAFEKVLGLEGLDDEKKVFQASGGTDVVFGTSPSKIMAFEFYERKCPNGGGPHWYRPECVEAAKKAKKIFILVGSKGHVSLAYLERGSKYVYLDNIPENEHFKKKVEVKMPWDLIGWERKPFVYVGYPFKISNFVNLNDFKYGILVVLLWNSTMRTTALSTFILTGYQTNIQFD